LLEYCILSIINHHEAYASDILDILKEAQLVVVEGTVYPLLTRMKNEGLLSYRWQESTGGPPRKYYALSDAGKQLLAQLNDEWQTICQAINQVTQ
jgi:PadR family transcriptional regulator PadR